MEPDTRQTRRFRAETTLPPLSPHAVEIDEASQLPQRVGTGRFLGTPRYGVGRELGRGAFGVVYEAFDRQREKRVALKVLRELSGDALYRFKREFRSLSDVSHENLVELYELVSDGERWFFAMELVRGVTFLQHVAAPTHEQRLRRAMLGLARGVDALHRAAKLHCDIKPSNVLVGGSGQVKLLDFGLVTESQSSQRSADETVFGTVAYMAPEQAAGAASPASDWYAVGAMLYEALTGRLPFMGTPMQILVAKQHGEVAPIRDAPAELRDLATLAGRMLARDAKQRPEAEEILARLGDDEDSGPHRVGRRARVSTAPFEQQGRRFVGRRHELARLRAAYQRAAEREGAAVVVNVFGGSGMGKTTLVRHFLDGLREERDAVVLLGRCYEHESVPFKSVDSLIDSLCRYLRRLDSNDVDRLLPRDVRALARLFPVLDRVGSIARAPCVRGGDERQLRLRAFAALRELLARIADRASLVLWIDDMQWSDGDSHALLLDLLSQSVPPFLLIASYRSNSNRMPQLALPDATAIENVYIGALDKDDAHELARQAVVDARGATDADACSTASADDTAALVAREARGVPFLIGELARHHGAGNIGALRLDQLLVARVAALPPPARTLLEVVALAGRPIAKHIAARAACLDADGSDALAILARARMVQTRGSRWCLVETYHDSIRESVVEHLDASTRRHLHYRIALALEAAGVRDPEALLTHFRGAGDLSRAAQQAEVAARRAASHLAFDQAARMYSMALELTPEGGLQRAALREKLGIALANAGRAVEAGHELLAAAAAAPREHARPLERRAAEQLVLGGRIDEGVEILYRVCEADGQRLPRSTRSALASFAWQRTKLRLRGMRFSPTDERDVDPAALRRLDSELTLAAGLGVVNPASGALWATRALLGALRSGEPGRVAQALAYEVGIRSALGWRGGAELIARARAIAAEVDRPDVSGSVSFGSGVVAYFDGRFDDALSDLVAAERDFTTARALPWQRTTARWFALLVLFHLGDLRRYSQRTCELLREAEERGDLHLQASVLGGPGQYHWLMRDRAEELRARLDETMAAWSQKRFQLQHHFELWANTLIDLYIDQPRAALARVERAWPEIERSPLRYTKMIYCTLLWLRAVARLACAEQLSASSERRRALREVGADVARMRRLAQPCFRAIELGLEAGIARVSGDDDRALVKLDEAIGCAERQGMTSAVMVFSWQRARVAGDEASRLVKARLDAQLHAQGVVNIERTLHSIAPGFRR